MMEPSQITGTYDPTLSHTMPQPPSGVPSFRQTMPDTYNNSAVPNPPLPPRPDMTMAVQPNSGYNNMNYSYGGLGNNYMMSNYGYNGYGNGYGNYGGFAGYDMGGMAGYGGYNRPMYGDIENRFIQIAEENSRPAFDSIQSIVGAVGSIAMMLESTFIALRSSFRAILGVAENFGRLRSLFAQFWSTFAVIRSINWLIRKLLVILGIRTESEFKAWAQAVAATQAGTATPEQRPRGSGWPIMLFLGIIAGAPYIVLKMLSGLNNSINERLNDPTTWQNPLRAVAQHSFQATTPQEVSFSANQILYLAPKELQGNLWNSGWLMASTDRQTAGLIPVNYIKVIRPTPENGNAITPQTENTNPTSKEPVVQSNSNE